MTAPRLVGNDPPGPFRLVRPEEDTAHDDDPVPPEGADGSPDDSPDDSSDDSPDDRAALAASLTRPERFALVFDRHAATIRGYCARRVGPGAAEDLVAEVFLTAFEQRARFDPQRAVAPWLFGIATNLLRRSRRQEERAYRAFAATGRDPLREEVVEGVADRAAERVDADRLSRPLASALAAMPAHEREVLLLLAWANLGYAEIAQALDIPVGTVRSRLSRARARLRSALSSRSAGEPPLAEDAL